MYTRSQTRCCVYIQRAWRRYRASRRCCPISLCVIPAGRVVHVGRQVYDALFLAKFIEARGDYRCPITRSPIAPHILHSVEDMTGVPVWSSRDKFLAEAKAQRERTELLTYYSHTVDRHVGTVLLALLDENRSPRQVMSTVVESLRSLTSVLVQYTFVDRQRALMAIQAAEAAVESVVCFHTFSQNLAVRFLNRFRRDVTSSDPPPGPQAGAP